MDIRQALKEYAGQPLTHQLLISLLSGYKRPNDKIHQLMEAGVLQSVKRGIYVPGPRLEMAPPEPFLLANHILGPSYVSMDSALSWHGLIPERVYSVSSATVKASRSYNTSVGVFGYIRLPVPYYSFGIRQENLSRNQTALIATPEKALCDKIVTTPGVLIRSVKEAWSYMMDDLRIDEAMLKDVDTEMIKTWIAQAPKASSLSMTVKMIEIL